jgi:hypothetical protein
MRKVLVPIVAALATPALAAAAELELAGYAGYTFPFYSQTFAYDPGPVDIPIPGVGIEQGGAFELEASGGLVLAGGLTFFATDRFGLELRLDSADMSVDIRSNSYSVRVDLPAPHDPVLADLELEKGTAEVRAPAPWSFNVKLRSGGESVRLTTSGGLSRLGNLDLAIEQTVALGVVAVNLETNQLEVATLRLRGATGAEAESSWGGNLGLGIQINIGERGALVLEGRGFYFPKRTIEWEPVIEEPLAPLEALLLERVLDRLDPIEFKPFWVQATIGIAIRF